MCTGKWANDVIKSGTLNFLSGDQYDGEISPAFAPHGKGRMRYADGCVRARARVCVCACVCDVM